jgi:putative glutamine amidotransferase
MTIGIVAIVAIILAVYIAWSIWLRAGVPVDAPRIGISVDETWLNELGILRSTYDQAMTRAGGRLVTLNIESLGASAVNPESVRALLKRENISGLLLTGGGDVDPALYGGDTSDLYLVNRPRDDFEIALVHAGQTMGLPILGICRGCQVINVAYGGTLKSLREGSLMSGPHFAASGHGLTIASGTQVHRIMDVEQLPSVRSFHGQSVDRVGDELQASAHAADGLVEAVEWLGPHDAWIIGVQWHPEMAPLDRTQNRLFHALVEAAGRGHTKPD